MEKEVNFSQDNIYDIGGYNSKKLGRFEIIQELIKKNGKIYPFSYINQKNSVGILLRVDNRFVLLRQYRHTMKEFCYEIPGGGIENKFDTPEEVAKREVLEETGYQVYKIEKIGEYYPSPGSSNEVTYLYFAHSCSDLKSKKNLEPLEIIEDVFVTEAEFEKLIREGKIKHSMTLVAWLYYKQNADKFNEHKF